MNYSDFLKWLLSLGPELPEIIASIQRIIVEIQFIRGKLNRPESFAAEASVEEAALEQQVIVAAMGGTETFGGPLQKLLDFIRNNQELIKLLISLFTDSEK